MVDIKTEAHEQPCEDFPTRIDAQHDLTALQESRLIDWLDERLLERSRLIKRRVMRQDSSVTLAEILEILHPVFDVIARIPKTKRSSALATSYLITIIDTVVDDIEMFEEMPPTIAFELLSGCDAVLYELLAHKGNLVDLTSRTRLDAILARARQVMFTLYASPENEKALSDVFDRSIAII